VQIVRFNDARKKVSVSFHSISGGVTFCVHTSPAAPP
jgi:hypothetical protein